MAKKVFIMYLDNLPILDNLNNSQVGQLFRAIKAYHCGESVKPFTKDPVVSVVFNQLKRDIEKYESIVESRRENGRLGGLAKAGKSKQNVAKRSKSKQTVAKVSKTKQNVANCSKSWQNLANEENKENQTVTSDFNEISENFNENDKKNCNTSNSSSVVDSIINNNINNSTEKKRVKKRKDTPKVIPFPNEPTPKTAKADDFVPPTLKEVEACFMQSAAQLPTWQDEAKIFFYHYDGLGWRNTHGVKIRNWDSFANKWIFDKINENKRRTNRQSDKRTTTAVDPDCGLIEPPSSM